MSPAGKRRIVGRVDDLEDGQRMIVSVEGKTMGIFREGGEFYAIRNRCPHQGAALCRGDVVSHIASTRPTDVRYMNERRFLVCPWHNWEFELASGKSYFDPKKVRAKSYQVQVCPGADLVAAGDEGGDEAGLVEGPYSVETYEIDIEDEYIVVVLR